MSAKRFSPEQLRLLRVMAYAVPAAVLSGTILYRRFFGSPEERQRWEDHKRLRAEYLAQQEADMRAGKEMPGFWERWELFKHEMRQVTRPPGGLDAYSRPAPQNHSGAGGADHPQKQQSGSPTK